MTIQDIYSKRNKKPIDVYVYHYLPLKLKVQIGHILTNFAEQYNYTYSDEYWQYAYKIICEEHGFKYLDNRKLSLPRIIDYFDRNDNIEECMDIIEITFRTINAIPESINRKYGYNNYISYTPSKCIEDLNRRFLENGAGYEYQNGKIIRIDNKLLHSETVVQTLTLLYDSTFTTANQEFFKALEHYRHGRNKECINECLKSFESTMKIICKLNKWDFEEKATAKILINILMKNDFLPTYHESQMHGLRQQLEGTIPTIRNKNSAHGQGNEEIIVAKSLTNFIIYSTATTINFLVDSQSENLQST